MKMRNAWMGGLVAGMALVACGGTPVVTPDAGGDAGGARDTGTVDDTGPAVDTGVVRDGGRADANLEPYDGGPPAMCSGLTPVAIADYCTAYADAYVAWYQRCNIVGARGMAQLRTALLDGCDTSAAQAAVTAGRTVYDGADVACCFAHAAADATCYGGFGSGVDECATGFTGTTALGGSCTSGLDCNAMGYCHVGATCPGTCTAFAADGERCDLGDVSCRPGSDCDTGYAGATDVCIAQTGRAGATCDLEAGQGCLPGLGCTEGEAGVFTCVAVRTRGQDCDGNSLYCDLESGICDYDITTESGICVPHYTAGTMHCVANLQCEADFYCEGADVRAGTYGTCTARAAAGESCATAECLLGTTCLPSGVCGDAPAVGEACNPGTGCAGANFCSLGTGTCQAGRAAGETCSRNDFCASGNCDATTRTCAPDCTP